MVLLGLAIALSAWGDPTTLTISNASVTVTSSSSTTLNFPISRGGDTSYDAFVQYQTQDGTAVAGTDYTAASGSLVPDYGGIGAEFKSLADSAGSGDRSRSQLPPRASSRTIFALAPARISVQIEFSAGTAQEVGPVTVRKML